MKTNFTQLASFLLALVVIPIACAPSPSIASGPARQPYLITGSFQVTNDFILDTYYVENAVALTDMHGFVIRDQEWVLPVDSQVLGFMTFDARTLKGTYELSLPSVPRGEFNDVDQDGKKDQGVQIFTVAYSPNQYGSPFAEGDDRIRGWPTYLASVKTNPEKHDEVIGGRLVVWAPDAHQKFPDGFGKDGLLFTEDDPVEAIAAGYSIVNLDQSTFAFIQTPTPELTLYEPSDITIKDFSSLSYSEAFDKMFEAAKKEYAFTDIKGKAPDWDTLYEEIKPRVELAEKNKDPNAFYLGLRDFTRAFKDGHVSLEAGDFAAQDFQNAISGGYDFAIRVLDDNRVVVSYVVEGGPAAGAGMQVGAAVTAFNGLPIALAIGYAHSYSNQSSDFAIRYQKARYLLRASPGTQAEVTFANPSGVEQTVVLSAVAERESFNRTSLYFGVDPRPLLPVDEKIIQDADISVGYIRINSNYDDLNLVIRLFERALRKFRTYQVSGIIIDLRYNSGGAPLNLSGFLTDQEIPLGQLEYFNDATGHFEPESPRDKVRPNQHQYRFDKMVLLVGPACINVCEIEAFGFSQVPGMIVAGQYPTAGVVAETARGKFALPEGFSLTIPTGRYTLQDGSIFLEGQGVPPTLRIPVDETTVFSTEDVVLQAAIQAIRQPFGSGIPPSGHPKLASKAQAESALSAGTGFLENAARESFDPSHFTRAGVVTFTIPLMTPKTLIWAYWWCAANADILIENLNKIQLNFELDGKDIPIDQMAVSEVELNGKQCRIIYTALSDWPAGEHHLSTIAIFTDPINDGLEVFEPGNYVTQYSVYVKP